MAVAWRSGSGRVTVGRGIVRFGIGIGLYFRQLLALGIVCALCAVLLLFPTLKNAAVCDQGSIGLLTGSAVGCDRQALDVGWHAVPDILVCLMLLTWAAAASKAEAAAVKVIDEHMQTPSDYAIVVENPPLERDPDVWQAHFAEWGQVVFITVSLNNGDLLEAAHERARYHAEQAKQSEELSEWGIAQDAKYKFCMRALLNNAADWLLAESNMGLSCTVYLECTSGMGDLVPDAAAAR